MVITVNNLTSKKLNNIKRYSLQVHKHNRNKTRKFLLK